MSSTCLIRIVEFTDSLNFFFVQLDGFNIPLKLSLVLGFWGAKHIFKGEKFLLLLYVLNKFFWVQQNLGVNKKIGGHCPRNPRGYEPEVD